MGECGDELDDDSDADDDSDYYVDHDDNKDVWGRGDAPSQIVALNCCMRCPELQLTC